MVFFCDEMKVLGSDESSYVWRKAFVWKKKVMREHTVKWFGWSGRPSKIFFVASQVCVCVRVCVCVCESVCVRTRRMLCRVRQIQSSAAGCWEKSSRVEKPSKTETRTFYCGVWGRLQLQSSKWITANNSARTRESRRPCGLWLPPFFIFRGEFWFVLTGT